MRDKTQRNWGKCGKRSKMKRTRWDRDGKRFWNSCFSFISFGFPCEKPMPTHKWKKIYKPKVHTEGEWIGDKCKRRERWNPMFFVPPTSHFVSSTHSNLHLVSVLQVLHKFILMESETRPQNSCKQWSEKGKQKWCKTNLLFTKKRSVVCFFFSIPFLASSDDFHISSTR